MVAQGWLVADALGLHERGSVIERGDAFQLGGAVRNRAGKIRCKIDSLLRAVAAGDTTRDTALMHAAQNRHATTVRALLQADRTRRLTSEALLLSSAEYLFGPTWGLLQSETQESDLLDLSSRIRDKCGRATEPHAEPRTGREPDSDGHPRVCCGGGRGRVEPLRSRSCQLQIC